MTELSERAMADPSSVTDEQLAELVGTAATSTDIDPAATEAVTAVFEDAPDRAGTVTTALADRLSHERPDGELLGALELANELATLHPGRTGPLLPAVIAFVDHGNVAVEEAAMRTLQRIAPENPEAIADHPDTVGEMLEADRPLRRRVGVELAVALAEHDPDAARSLLDGLVAVVTAEYESEITGPGPDSTETVGGNLAEPTRAFEHEARNRKRHRTAREQAAVALAVIAEHDPGAVAQYAETIGAVVGTTGNSVLRYGLVDVLAPVAESHPEEAMVALGSLVDCFDSTADPRNLARVARTVSFLADADERRVADAVRPHLDAVIGLLAADEPEVQNAAAGLLMYVGEHYPEPVAEATDLLIRMLDAEDPPVRGSAAWVLGIVGGEDAHERLGTVAGSDPVEEVRVAAEQAIERIESRLA